MILLSLWRRPKLYRPLAAGINVDVLRSLQSRVYGGTASSSTASPSPLQAWDKILIANRGEIASRIISTAKRMQIKTVAVYSEADATSAHVRAADEAILIGPAPSRDSYLSIPKIISAAKQTGAQAVHPGYGFLSENSKFAAACREAGLTFIGPPPSAIDAMGSKGVAKEIMARAGVATVPGYHGEDQSTERFLSEASKIGYPVLLKAIMGGGGKGMRIVRGPDELEEALLSAKREAMASFGDARMLVERFIQRPRHIEVQVFADTHGNCVHLFERDCSIQRRHQKVVEEAPAVGVSNDFRRAIGQAAVDAAKAVGYVNAGTVEFIVDADTGEFFFMEMNTRLQVEHPVTELITGQDLVAWQLHVGMGHPLPLAQEQLAITGHAAEVRVYAEDVAAGFLPGAGRVLHLRTPPNASRGPAHSTSIQGSVGQAPSGSPSAAGSTPMPLVRLDFGVWEGDAVGAHYDPMIGKLITWGPTREDTLRTMHKALGELQIAGLPVNVAFLRRVIAQPQFRAGVFDTTFIQKHLDQLLPAPSGPGTLPRDRAQAMAVACVAMHQQSLAATGASLPGALPMSPWDQLSGMRLNAPPQRSTWHLRCADEGRRGAAEPPATQQGQPSATAGCHLVHVTPMRGQGHAYQVQVADLPSFTVRAQTGEGGTLTAEVDGHRCRVSVFHHADPWVGARPSHLINTLS
eukprot:jgi/Mesvir1/14317/Mv09733-RA.2